MQPESPTKGPVSEGATVTEDTSSENGEAVAPENGEDEDQLTKPPSHEYAKRVLSLRNMLSGIAEEKEKQRLRIEGEFQEHKQRLSKEWEEVQKNFDLRMTAVNQELVKAQGVMEYLQASEKPTEETNTPAS